MCGPLNHCRRPQQNSPEIPAFSVFDELVDQYLGPPTRKEDARDILMKTKADATVRIAQPGRANQHHSPIASIRILHVLRRLQLKGNRHDGFAPQRREPAQDEQGNPPISLTYS